MQVSLVVLVVLSLAIFVSAGSLPIPERSGSMPAALRAAATGFEGSAGG